jgi:PAS domain S-box-containing protein
VSTPAVRAATTTDHLAAIVESSNDLIITKDTNAVITSWNPAAERIYGWTAEEAVGQNVSMLIPEHRRGEERRILERILAGERLDEYETERVRKDGEMIVVSLTISPLRDAAGEIVGASVIGRDVTRRHRSRVLAERIQDLTLALTGEVEPGHAVELLLEQAVKGTGADAATVGMLVGDGAAIEIIDSHGHDASGLAKWKTFPLDANLPMTEAVKTGRTLWIGSADELSERYPAIPRETVRFDCLAVIPLTVEGRTVGSLSLSFLGDREFDAELEAFLYAVAEQAAHALERNRLRDAEQRTTRRLAFLAEAGELLAGSLNLETTLARLADLTVEWVADWCAIDLLDSEGRVGTSTVSHKDPARVRLAEELRERYPPDLSSDRGLGGVLKTGEPQIYPEIPDELLRESAQDEEHLRRIRELGMKSAIVAPLPVRGRIIGAITVISAESGERYGPEELRLVSDLARRAALAIDNSMLFAREHEAAVTLQRSLLPQSLPPSEHLDLAARYEPAAPGLEVGGDWYEVIIRDDGKVGLTIGDVAGRGIRAASVMGRVRQALSAYVLEGHGPSEAVTRLNRVLRDSPRPEMVTLLHMLIDPRTGEGSYVRAGHPPAVVMKPDGTTEVLLGQGIHPLGIMEDATAPAIPVRLDSGSLLLLYTDGLIERRDADLNVGLERLISALADAPRDAEPCLAWLAERLEADAVPDDVAMLAVRLRT